MANPLIEAAKEYLSLGLSVIALSGKTPNGRVHRHGLLDAIRREPGLMTDLSAFEHRDTTGVGVLTEWPYVVVDIDSEVGAQNWATLAGDEFTPDRWVAKTAKGLHLWFKSVEPVNTFKPFGADGGIDLKGNGGYVAAPPSWHPGDPKFGIEPGMHYEWILPPDAEAQPYVVPEGLMARIRKHNFEQERIVTAAKANKRVRHDALEGGILYASWGFDAVIEGMTNAADGNRNNYLHWAAAVMAEEGGVDEDFEQLREVALKAGLTPLEVKRTLRSARRG